MREWELTHRGSTWIAPEGVEVMTKIEDSNGSRNEQTLVREGNLWWTPDMAMYVYYTPTHWKKK